MNVEKRDKDRLVPFVQLHVDKSVTYTKPTSISAHPIQPNLMTLLYELWKRQIFSEQANTTYLTVCIQHKDKVWKMPENGNLNKSPPQVVRLTLLQIVFDGNLNSFGIDDDAEFHCITWQGEKSQWPSMLVTPAPNLPQRREIWIF